MKKKISLLVVTSLLAIASAASAGNKAESFSISPVIGGYTYDGRQHLDTNLVYGARAGYNFTKELGVEALFDFVTTEPTKASGDVNMYRYGGEFLYHFFPDNKLVPYIAAGYAGLNFEGDVDDRRTRGAFDYGIGAKYFLNDNFALRTDIRHLIYKFDRSNSNLEYTIGAYIPFGGMTQAAKPVEPPPEPAPAPVAEPVAAPAPVAPADSDKDGVGDPLDKCPGTPAGVKVDSDGCPIDSDKDGVPDYLDKCPGTPVGVKVDSDGCPIDSDKDGVPDYLDKCPGTPIGVKVDAEGCPPQKAATGERFCSKPAVLEIHFDFDKSDIKPMYHDELKTVGDFLMYFPNAKGEISGHTDSIGSNKYNQKLSERRAVSVEKYISSTFGVNPGRITTKGFGETKPIASNKTKADRAKNRRIEANFTCE